MIGDDFFPYHEGEFHFMSIIILTSALGHVGAHLHSIMRLHFIRLHFIRIPVASIVASCHCKCELLMRARGVQASGEPVLHASANLQAAGEDDSIMHHGRNLLTRYVGEDSGEEDMLYEYVEDEYVEDMMPAAAVVEGTMPAMAEDEGMMSPPTAMGTYGEPMEAEEPAAGPGGPCGSGGQPVCAGEDLDGAALPASLCLVPRVCINCVEVRYGMQHWGIGPGVFSMMLSRNFCAVTIVVMRFHLID